MPKRQTPAAPPSALTRDGAPSASHSAPHHPALAAAPAHAADGDDLNDLDLFPIYTTTNTGVSEIFLIDAPPTYSLRAHEEGGSTLFQLTSSSQTDTADADIFPIYVSPSLRGASFFEQGDLDDLIGVDGVDGVDDPDLFPIEVSAGMSSETSALFALAQLGARGRPAASTHLLDIADDADSASHSPAEGSMLFRLSDLGQRPFVDDDPLADTETPADDDDLMPIYLPPGLSGTGARAQRSAPPSARVARSPPSARASPSHDPGPCRRARPLPTRRRGRPRRAAATRPAPSRLLPRRRANTPRTDADPHTPPDPFPCVTPLRRPTTRPRGPLPAMGH
jgi:hypothetical protein